MRRELKTETSPQNVRRKRPDPRWVTHADAVAALVLAIIFIVCVAAIVIRQHTVGKDTRVRSAEGEPARYFVDLNRAAFQELMLLPGIGEVRAGRIVAWREEHGPFRSLEEVRQATGLSAAGVEGLKAFVTFGETAPTDEHR